MSKLLIGFSKSKKKFAPYAKLIMFLDKCPFSHVYVRIPRASGVDVIYQAAGSVVNFVGTKRFQTHSEIVEEFEFEVTDETRNKFFDWAIKYAGTPYSMKAALGIGLAILFRLHKNPLCPASPTVCSLLAGFVLQDFLNAKIDLDALGIAGPKEIYNVCEGIKSGNTDNKN